MNESKPKTVFEERDELRRNYDRVRAAFEKQTIENVQLRSQLATTEQANAERMHLLAEYTADNFTLSNRLAAAEEALAQVQRESKELRERYEAARKVADAAVAENVTSRAHVRFTELPEPDCEEEDAEGILLDAFYSAQNVVDDAVREYRALTEPQGKEKADERN